MLLAHRSSNAQEKHTSQESPRTFFGKGLITPLGAKGCLSSAFEREQSFRFPNDLFIRIQQLISRGQEKRVSMKSSSRAESQQPDGSTEKVILVGNPNVGKSEVTQDEEGRTYPWGHYIYGNHKITGITARILKQLLDSGFHQLSKS
jgi:hypothetical protein